MSTAGARMDDPLSTLREYRQLAPWNLRDLATLTGAILEASAVRPINAAASVVPSERTIRFYVTRGLVTPPEGRGTAAIYSYRHLLQVLAIKLRQMEGGTLESIARELTEMTGDVLERRVAAALGAGVPAPHQLPLGGQDVPPRGRSGRALRPMAAVDESEESAAHGGRWSRVQVSKGVELHIRDDHPLARGDARNREIADAVRLAVARLLSHPRPGQSPPDAGEPT
jgi:DNA-binding transcriptional MerR regulator